MQKPALRQIYKQKRSRLSAAEITEMENRMLHHFMQHQWPPVKELFTYIPITGKNEPDPFPFTRYIQSCSFMQTGAACRISAPVISNKETNDMQAVYIDETTNYQPGIFGTTEPDSHIVVPPQQIDMILVPLLAFDVSGNRIGYGKGYYDRFMARCRSNTIRAGLSFFPPEPAIESTPGFDVPLTHCITPAQIYVF